MTPIDPAGKLPRHLLGALFYSWTWRMAWRDSRTQRKRLVIFSLSIVAGIAALVAIHSLKATVESGIATQAKALLGSDLQISSRQPFPEEKVKEIAALAQSISRETSVSSMLYFASADSARLVHVRALEGGYPFYGKIETAPSQAWERMQMESGILLEPALLDQFQVKVGDRVKLGSVELPILGTLKKGAPTSGRFSGFSPDVYVRLPDLERAGLLSRSSLATYRLHLKLDERITKKSGLDAQPAAAREIRTRFNDSHWQFETPESRRNSLGDSLDNFQQFLGILALVALTLGAIGVAGAIHAHVSRRVPTVAILRCLGCPGNLAFGIYLAQAIALGLLGAVAGAALGIALHSAVITLLRESLPIAVNAIPSAVVVLETTAAGFIVCCGFALMPLFRVRDISPAATLRQTASRSPGARLRTGIIFGLLAAMLTLLGAMGGGSWSRSLMLTGALAVAFLILAGIAAALIVVTRRVIRPSWPYVVRQGISNLYRPQNQTLLFLLSLGLGTFLLLTVLLIRNSLFERIRVADPASSPSLYLVDVQPDQLDGVRAVLKERHLPELESAPIVTMRIESIKGVPIRELEAAEDETESDGKARFNQSQNKIPKWVLQREYRSSYRNELSATESIVVGQWFSGAADPNGAVPLSLESEIAKDLHVTVGDEMVLDVQGIPIRARIANLRKVDWSRFNLNFFMIFPPGVLESAPGFHVITTRTPGSSGELQRALVTQFPNVSAIDLTLILETVGSILERIGRVIQIMAAFTVVAGIPILVGTLLNGRSQRFRESVLLRTLGASSRQVRRIFLVEYATLGVLSAISGVILAVAANAALALFVFKASPWPDPWLLLAGLATASGLSVAAGVVLSRGVSNHPPLQILRGDQ
ncbi:MAG: macB 4 [Chthoniobacteraceae bacterium]|nr:macB 4 [Chthoniobacteraceae bacterium]